VIRSLSIACVAIWAASVSVAGAGEMPIAEFVYEDGVGLPVNPLVFESQPAGLSGTLDSEIRVDGGTFVGTMPFDTQQASPLTFGTLAISNGPGVFAASAPGADFEGTMPIAGEFAVGGFGGATFIRFPLTQMSAGGAVTAGLGVGGTLVVPQAGGSPVTVTFGRWTSGTAFAMSVATESGVGTLTRVGSVVTGNPARLSLVTPIRVTSTTLLAEPVASFARVTYSIGVPEPGLALMTALGSAILGVAAWRRRRAGSPTRPERRSPQRR